MASTHNNELKQTKKQSIFKKVWDFVTGSYLGAELEYPVKEDIERYLKERFKPQHSFYKQRVRHYELLYHGFQILIIIASAIIPIVNLTTSTSQDNNIRIVSSLLGTAIVIFTGILQLAKAQENWILFMSTVDSLENEYYLFSHSIEPYSKEEDRNKIFIQGIESIIRSKSKQYVSTIQTTGYTQERQ
jgi:hypothetical protein